MPDFARLESRANAAVMRHLANACARIDGRDVRVIFDARYDAPFDEQIDDSAAMCTGPTADLATLERGSAITIDGTAYTVTRAEPDGTGLTRLILGAVA